jgi:hypothetical protein
MDVKDKKDRFSAVGMFEALKVKGSAPLSVTGLIKEEDGDATAVLLAVPPHADRWIRVPEDQISSFERVGSLRLDDRDHQLVRLNLKKPETPEGEIFHDLLAAHQAGARATALHVASAARIGTPAAAAYCYFDANGKWVCS